MSEAVKSFLDRAGVEYRIHVADSPTRTAQEAADRLNVPLSVIIKSVVFTDQEGSPVLAIVTGDRRVDRGKLSAALGVSKVRIANPESALRLTGFEVGAMPPIGHKNRITTVIDRTAMGFSRVYGGAGTAHTLLEIDPKELARLTSAAVTDISE